MPRFIVTVGRASETGKMQALDQSHKAHAKKFYLTAADIGDAERIALMMSLKGEVVIDIKQAEDVKVKRKPKPKK